MNYLLVLTLALFGVSHAQLQLRNLRKKLSNLQCEPVEGHEEDILPCYDLKTGNLAKVEECGKGPKFIHCCKYDCKCIIKGAGDPKGTIPGKFLTDMAKDESARKAAFREQIFEDCVVETTAGSVLAAITNATEAYSSEAKVAVTTAPLPNTEESDSSEGKASPSPATSKSTPKATKKPKTSKKPRKPGSKKPGSKKPGSKKPGSKKPGKRTTTKKPRRTRKPKTTTPCLTTTTKEEPSFSFLLFGRLADILTGFGFDAERVPVNCV